MLSKFNYAGASLSGSGFLVWQMREKLLPEVTMREAVFLKVMNYLLKSNDEQWFHILISGVWGLELVTEM